MRPFLPSALAVAFTIFGSAEPRAQQILREHAGTAENEYNGASFARLSDIDGDGVTDYAIGAPGASYGTAIPQRGRVTVYSGRTGSVLHLQTGWEANARFGQAIEAHGDVDGDGLVDYAVGAPGATNGQPASGAVSLRSGRDGRQIWRSLGSPSGGNFGTSLASIGDVDADGVRDLVVGAPRRGGWWPSVVLISGRTGAHLSTYTNLQNDELGACVANAGDLDGIPGDEVLVGAPLWSGVVLRGAVMALKVRQGRLELMHLLPNTSSGFGVHSRFGHAIASLGDLDGDGRNEFAVGAPGSYGQSSFTEIYDGRFQRRAILPGGIHQGLGEALAAVGDFNGDGTGELAVTEGRYDTGIARIRFVPVTLTGTVSSYSFYLDGQVGEAYGRALAAAGDVDRDGIDDVWIAAPFAVQGTAPYAGKSAFLRYAPSGSIVSFGTPCVNSSTVATLSGSGDASSGSELLLSSGPLLGQRPAFLLAGTAALTNPIALPPTCWLHVLPEVVLPVTTEPMPHSPIFHQLRMTLPLPAERHARGASIFFQFVDLDPLAPAGFATSNGLAVTIGR